MKRERKTRHKRWILGRFGSFYFKNPLLIYLFWEKLKSNSLLVHKFRKENWRKTTYNNETRGQKEGPKIDWVKLLDPFFVTKHTVVVFYAWSLKNISQRNVTCLFVTIAWYVQLFRYFRVPDMYLSLFMKVRYLCKYIQSIEIYTSVLTVRTVKEYFQINFRYLEWYFFSQNFILRFFSKRYFSPPKESQNFIIPALLNRAVVNRTRKQILNNIVQ